MLARNRHKIKNYFVVLYIILESGKWNNEVTWMFGSRGLMTRDILRNTVNNNITSLKRLTNQHLHIPCESVSIMIYFKKKKKKRNNCTNLYKKPFIQCTFRYYKHCCMFSFFPLFKNKKQKKKAIKAKPPTI